MAQARIKKTLVCFVSVLGSELYCFSCFGFNKDDSSKCLSREAGNLHVRKCTTNSSDLPACIKYTAHYKLPQMMGDKLVLPFVEVHGVHCGTSRQCYVNECPNFWPDDVTAKECQVDCCDPRKEACAENFPVPNDDDIKKYNERNGGSGGDVVSGTGPGSVNEISDATKLSSWSVWLPIICFAICKWLNLQHL